MSSPSKSKFIRIWREVDSEGIKKQLLYIDDLYGTCGNCKHLGLNYLKDKICPTCKVEFKYMASLSKNSGEIQKILARMKKENINLTLIDRDDFEISSAKDAAANLFKI
jgi:hypothetical protein